MTKPPPDPDALAALAATGPTELRELLLEICSSPAWADAVAAARPWSGRTGLLAANAAATAGLSPPTCTTPWPATPRSARRGPATPRPSASSPACGAPSGACSAS
ncbi:hypothetical protein [Kitasatospora cheerisanensis]|uniref:hypothetical protein n=1 Tax=Kitasatospora cheerisanensis TaxID=81942 RepID=UPI0006900979|nr:hypothetical protein [Kitasatospora cheerisanensis]